MPRWEGFGIGAGHFASGLVYVEHPVHTRADVIALALPGGDLAGEVFFGGDALIEALAAQDADLDLDHGEPACVLWGVVELQAAAHTPGFGRVEGAVEGGRAVGGEIVEHDPDL